MNIIIITVNPISPVLAIAISSFSLYYYYYYFFNFHGFVSCVGVAHRQDEKRRHQAGICSAAGNGTVEICEQGNT